MLYGNQEQENLWKLDTKFASLAFETLEFFGLSFVTLSPLQLKKLEKKEMEKQRKIGEDHSHGPLFILFVLKGER